MWSHVQPLLCTDDGLESNYSGRAARVKYMQCSNFRHKLHRALHPSTGGLITRDLIQLAHNDTQLLRLRVWEALGGKAYRTGNGGATRENASLPVGANQ